MTLVDETANVPILEPAGFWIRALARAIDWVFTFLIAGAVAILFGVIAALTEGITGRSTAKFIESLDKSSVSDWIGSVLAMLAYHAIFEGVAGTTLGKRITGLHVIGMDRTPIRFSQACRRSVGFIVDALFFGTIGATNMAESPEKQRVGDKWAETRVVFRRSLAQAELPTRGLTFVAGLAAAIVYAEVVTVLYAAKFFAATA